MRQNIKRFCSKLIDVSADFSKYKESDERIRKQCCGSMSYWLLIHLKDKKHICFKSPVLLFIMCGGWFMLVEDDSILLEQNYFVLMALCRCVGDSSA